MARIIEAKPRPRRTPKSPPKPSSRGERTGRSTSATADRGRVERLRVDEGGDGQRLDNFLIRHWKGVPKTRVLSRHPLGEVRVNKGRAGIDLSRSATNCLPPVRISTARRRAPASAAAGFGRVGRDDMLIAAIDKPARRGGARQQRRASGVIEQLRQHAQPEGRASSNSCTGWTAETSGLLLVAKKRSALLVLQEQFRRRETGKTYAALVAGAWPASRRVIDLALHKTLDAAGERHVRVVAAAHADGRRSISLVSVAAAWPDFTLLDVTIKTGRTHQIRVHPAHEGHPIVGDPKYGDFALNRSLARGERFGDRRFERMFLHARRLAFEHPSSRRVIEPRRHRCRRKFESLLAALRPPQPTDTP